MKTHHITALFVLLMCLTAQPSNAQQKSDPDPTMEIIKNMTSEENPGRMYLRDGRVIKKVIIYEITDIKLVYIKAGSLHDIALEDVERIEAGKSGASIMFKKTGTPRISRGSR